jgi:2-iminobutanoate/2-iminopropanoate deaminase
MNVINIRLVTHFFAVLISIALSPQASGEPEEYFSSQRNIDNNYPFSNAVRVGSLLFLSGELGTLPNTSKLIASGIEAETKQTKPWIIFRKVWLNIV